MVLSKSWLFVAGIVAAPGIFQSFADKNQAVIKSSGNSHLHNHHVNSIAVRAHAYNAIAGLFSDTGSLPKPNGLKFRKQIVSGEAYETAAVFDVDHDGNPDIVSGAWWYPGPTFTTKHKIGDIRKEGEFYDDFSTIPMDVNGDGYLDFITGGWWGNSVRWRENPKGKTTEWPEHVIAECGNVETTRAWDIDKDGTVDIVPNNPNRPLLAFRLNKSTRVFNKYILYEKQGHGFGFGDINGDGRGDFVLSEGWLEAPSDPWTGKWNFHAEFRLGETGIPVIVTDLNNDGLSDMIVGQGHGYGLHWYQQKVDKQTHSRTWVKNAIDTLNSQFHTLLWEDIDGDGKPELITGKRYRAHDDKDPGSGDDYGLYYYKWTGKTFEKNVIVFGPKGTGKGTGNYFVTADLRKTGRKDIIVGGKDGLWIFYNEE
jgi:VCBS repeat protein